MKKLDPKLKDKIKNKADNCCVICGRWCEYGEPHHVVKVSEEPLLRNCETDIWYLDRECHHRTETEPGYNHKLQLQLQEMYFNMFSKSKLYTACKIAQMVNMPLEDVEKAMYKGRLKARGNIAWGEDVIRFLMGGKLYAE